MPDVRRAIALLAAVVVAPALSSIAHGQIVSIAGEKANQCGHGGVVCNGHQPFSLTELESGAIRLPVGASQTPEFVIVNDTGRPVTMLQFSYFGALAANAGMTCQINGPAQQVFGSCTVTAQDTAGSGSNNLTGPVNTPVEFTFVSSSEQYGIANGVTFDIKTAGFSHACQDQGYFSGNGNAHPLGPPSQ